jgi:hypothetical protein
MIKQLNREMEQLNANVNVQTTSVPVEDMQAAEQIRLMLLLVQDML